MPFDRLDYARRVIRAEAATLEVVAGRLDDGFDHVAELLFRCRGRVAVAGVGKSADVVSPTTNASPAESRASPKASSLLLPPRTSE